MPPRTPQRRPVARSRGYDSTVSIASASSAKALNQVQESPQQPSQEVQPQQKGNDDLKKLIETLKNKLGNNTGTAPQKQAPPVPKPKTTWNRSIIAGKEKAWSPKPAYTILTRVSNHEKVPVAKKGTELTINALPHAFLYKPGANGIKVDKLSIKSGKQLGIG